MHTDTTGLDPEGGDRIVEIAALEIFNGVLTEKQFHSYINPERDMPDSAFKVHGISESFLNEKPTFSSVVELFLSFIGEDPIVAHNADFDIRFINAELERVGRSPIGNDRVIDTLALARRKHPGASNSLDALCVRYGIDRSRRSKHGALIDSEILAEVYIELKGGRQTSLTLSSSKEARRIKPVRGLGERRNRLPPYLNFDDVQRHAMFVEKTSGWSLWSCYATGLKD